MVMETPSPQCVGLEFVRQYYTVLNKAPMHLHRFYSNNSLFMHGGPNVNDPTVGQADIHRKILSLNFQDCHAKIRMVDAHATLGSGVVIQVIGELSNNGMPLRRFMQTFVLAPQSARKYYVHNDIFRYQDEVFRDEGLGEEVSDPEEDLETSSGIVEGNYSSSSATVNGTSSAHHNHSHHREPEPSSPIPTPVPAEIIIPQSPSQVTPIPTSTPSLASPPQVPVPQTTSSTPVTPSNSLPVEPRPSTPPAPEVDGWGTAPSESDEWADTLDEPITQTPKKELTKSPSTQSEQSQASGASQSVSNEPKTYANLFKNTSSFTHSPSQHPPPPPPHLQNEQPTTIPQPTYPSQPMKNETLNSRSSAPPGGPSPGAPQSQGPGIGMRPSRIFHDDEKRRPTAPDCQQLFVGNLPHSIGEEQLRIEFTRFGKILDIRINTGKGKTSVKGPGHQVPNFGFIVFDDEDAVVRCLKSRPIYLNGENRINVEEKKARNRMEPSMGGGRPSSGGARGGGMSGGQGLMQAGGRGGGRGSFSRDNSRGGTGGSRGGGFMPRR